jgi:hypothetical protein
VAALANSLDLRPATAAPIASPSSLLGGGDAASPRARALGRVLAADVDRHSAHSHALVKQVGTAVEAGRVRTRNKHARNGTRRTARALGSS